MCAREIPHKRMRRANRFARDVSCRRHGLAIRQDACRIAAALPGCRGLVTVDDGAREIADLAEVWGRLEKLQVRLEGRIDGVGFLDAGWTVVHEKPGLPHQLAPGQLEFLLDRQERDGPALRVESEYRE